MSKDMLREPIVPLIWLEDAFAVVEWSTYDAIHERGTLWGEIRKATCLHRGKKKFHHDHEKDKRVKWVNSDLVKGDQRKCEHE